MTTRDTEQTIEGQDNINDAADNARFGRLLQYLNNRFNVYPEIL